MHRDVGLRDFKVWYKFHCNDAISALLSTQQSVQPSVNLLSQANKLAVLTHSICCHTECTFICMNML